MKNSNINCIQKQLNNGYKTIVKFGRRIQVELTKKQKEFLENQLRVARLLEPKMLWESMHIVPVTNETQTVVLGYRKMKVNGTYVKALHGDLN